MGGEAITDGGAAAERRQGGKGGNGALRCGGDQLWGELNLQASSQYRFGGQEGNGISKWYKEQTFGKVVGGGKVAKRKRRGQGGTKGGV